AAGRARRHAQRQARAHLVCVAQPRTICTLAVRFVWAVVQEEPWRMISVGAAGLSYVQPFFGSCRMVVPSTVTLTAFGFTCPRSLDWSGKVQETTCPRMALSAVTNACWSCVAVGAFDVS